NRSPYLSELVHRGHFGRQGIIASMRLYNTPVGKPEDLQVVQRYYIEDYWMKQLVDRDVDAIWKLPYDRPHCYLIPTLESYADLYKATGEQQYLDAVFGGWDLYKEYYQHIGGAISVCEGAPFPPKSNLLDGRTGELCGNVFWIFLNQRLHLLYPEEEKYVNEIEKSIYNVALPDQSQNGSIRYHTKLVHQKSDGDRKNTCCELQGTRLFSALPEFIYTRAKDGIFVDIFYPSRITWEQDGKSFTMETVTQFPDRNDVKLKLSLKKKAASNIRIRVPSWATRPMDITVNGKTVATGAPGSYVSLQREWSNNDVIGFDLPVGFKVSKYEGATKPYCDRDKHTHALEYGPILMAITGESISNGQVTLPFPASQLAGKLQPEDNHGHGHSHALHFKIAGADDATLRFVPYYEIEKEEMTCFTFFTGN
ncbi:MAG: glycoside hydrolase family 127 protein, partial [Bacteroidales bacterium]|nr:glycoside hydrolase family 127 protein [Bacteroidales bacterium]